MKELPDKPGKRKLRQCVQVKHTVLFKIVHRIKKLF